jgi:hypothetical protein
MIFRSFYELKRKNNGQGEKSLSTASCRHWSMPATLANVHTPHWVNSSAALLFFPAGQNNPSLYSPTFTSINIPFFSVIFDCEMYHDKQGLMSR